MRPLVYIFVLLVLGACTPNSVSGLLRNPPANLPPQSVIDSVPFVAQTEKFCGPAALAMVLEYYGQEADLDELGSAVFVPAKGGALQAEMAALMRRKGLVAYQLNNQLESLLGQLAEGYPVIILQNLGLKKIPFWHYAVAIGYDLQRAEIILHTGQRKSHRLSLKTFAYTWARSNNWALIPRPVGSFPWQADVKQAFLASTAFVNTPGQAMSAIPHYSAALKQWPGDEAFSIALSNEFYAKGQYSDAVDVLMEAASKPIKSALVFNNLAYSLAAKHCYAGAKQSAQCAVELNPSPEYRQSQQDVDEISEHRDLATDCPTISCD